MNEAVNDNVRWLPFGAMALAAIIATGFWKIEKGLEEPLKPADVYNEARRQEAPKAVMEGKQAPGFTLGTIDGKKLTLADYRGKMVFLNIWATWCAPCREEMPSMQTLYEKLAGPGFAMLTISIDKGPEEVIQFVEELGLTFPVAMDPEQKVASQYKITGVPETFLISPDGIVMHHIIGPGKWDEPSTLAAFERTIQQFSKL